MGIKTILYILIVPLVLYAFDAVDINRIFKKNRQYQTTLFYVMLSIGLSYLVVNFLYDFFLYSKFI